MEIPMASSMMSMIIRQSTTNGLLCCQRKSRKRLGESKMKYETFELKRKDGWRVGSFHNFNNHASWHERKWKGKYVLEFWFATPYCLDYPKEGFSYKTGIKDLQQAWQDMNLPGSFTFLEPMGGRGIKIAGIETTCTIQQLEAAVRAAGGVVERDTDIPISQEK
jgi:hypothetical protein